MARRLVPTGFCWCGCKTAVELGSFFAPGHDKKAEARVIMEVFGGVPQFLAAFGYAPEAQGPESASWVDNAMRLAGLRGDVTDKLALEYPGLQDRTGLLARTDSDVRLSPVSLADGAATFTLQTSDGAASIIIPFIDITAVYKNWSGWVVRVSGTLDGLKYFPFSSPTASRSGLSELRLKELGPLKDAAMEADERARNYMPPLHTLVMMSAHGRDDVRDYSIEKWDQLKRTIDRVTVDDQALHGLTVVFLEACQEADAAWVAAEAHGKRHHHEPTFESVKSNYCGLTYGNKKGDQLVASVHDAYVKLSRHLESLLR